MSELHRITPEDHAAGFVCGVHELDKWFAEKALSNHTRGFGATYVMRGRALEPPITAFVTLTMAEIEAASLPRLQRRPHRLGVALIGRFAVHKEMQGKGLGAELLFAAFQKIATASELVGCYGIIVDAKDANAEGFYTKAGFTVLDAASSPPRRMFLSMTHVFQALKAAELASPRAGSSA